MKKFKMPSRATLNSRSSTITNAFCISITPVISPKVSELDDYYKSLDLEKGKCAYCLQNAHSVDHIHSLIKNKLPSGYMTDIHNLIPCCQTCNSSKGSKSFEEWYLSEKNIKRLKNEVGLSEETINHRYETIKNHVKKYSAKPLDYKSILGDKLWNEYLDRHNNMQKILKENQKFCDELLEIISKKIK